MNGVTVLLECVVAAIGGCLGAALSALGGFVLFGLLGLVGFGYLLLAHDDHWLVAVAGGALLKPHVCFLGGVVATAYARKQDLVRCGKDIGRSALTYRRADVLAVGAAAGLAGSLVARLLDTALAGSLDTIALTVCLVPALLKRPWRLTESSDCDAVSHAVPSPYRFFERFSRPRGRTLAALVVGAAAALAACALWLRPESRPYAALPVFFLCGVCLLPTFLGVPIPATHHFAGPAGAVALAWVSAQSGATDLPAVALAALWGVAAAQVALLAGGVLESRFFTVGDIHIDPPAMAIAASTALFLGTIARTGVFHAAAGAQWATALALTGAAAAANYSGRGFPRVSGASASPTKPTR